MNLLDFSNAQKLKHLINETSKLTELEEGWLDGEGSVISVGSAVTANTFFMHCYNSDSTFFSQCKFYVYPVENGNISVEFEYGGNDWFLEAGAGRWRLNGLVGDATLDCKQEVSLDNVTWEECLAFIKKPSIAKAGD